MVLSSEFDLLVRTIIGEAQGEPDVGMAAVGHVIMNRVNNGGFGGRSIEEVVMAPSQFEPWSTRRGELMAIPTSSPEYRHAARIAAGVVGGRIPDPTAGATHFLNVGVVLDRSGRLPQWVHNMQDTAHVIGQHTFLGGQGGGGPGDTRIADAGSSTGITSDASPLSARELLMGGGSRGLVPDPNRPPGSPTVEDGRPAIRFPPKGRPRTTDYESITPPLSTGGSFDASTILSGRGIEAPEAPPPEPEEQSYLGGVLDSFTQGLSFGFGDELTALENSLLGGTDEQSFWEEYEGFLAQERGQQEIFGEEYPVTDFTAELAGGVTSSVVMPGAVAGTARTIPGAVGRGIGATGRGLDVARATTTGGRMLRAAGAGSAGGALYGIGDGQGFGGRGVGALFGTVFGGAGGVVGERIGSQISRLVAARLRSGRFIDRQGNLTPETQETLRAMGLDPSDVPPETWQRIDSFAKRNGYTPEAVRRGIASEWGTTLTRGQATMDYSELSFEEAARRRLHGDTAGTIMDGVDQGSHRAVRTAIQGYLKENVLTSKSILEAGDRVAASMNQARAARQLEITTAYGAIPESTGVDIRALPSLEASFRARLFGGVDPSGVVHDGIIFGADPNLNKQTRGLLKELDGMLARAAGIEESVAARAGLEVTDGIDDTLDLVLLESGKAAVPFRKLERLRRKAGGIANSTSSTDLAQEMRTFISTFDNWVERSITDSIIEGSEAGLTVLKEARRKHSEFRRLFSANQGKFDDVGPIIESLSTRTDLTSKEILDYVFGSGVVGAQGRTVRVLSRIQEILGEENKELWHEIRGAAWHRLLGGGDDAIEDMAASINEFTSGENLQMARAMFSEEEIKAMRRLGATMGLVTPDLQATLFSSASKVQRTSDAMNAVAMTMGHLRGPGTMAVSRLMARFGINFAAISKTARNIDPRGGLMTNLPAVLRAGMGMGRFVGIDTARGLTGND